MAAWGQACRVAARAGAASFRKQGVPGAESRMSSGLACSTCQQIRGMASGKELHRFEAKRLGKKNEYRPY